MSYKNALEHSIFQVIGDCADYLQTDAYVIGGFVRDFFLKRGDAKDIDIVAIGSGIELAEKVASVLKGKPEVTICWRQKRKLYQR
jgi:tRNA nucleotidyltransferase/poly(A) polymerase